MTVHLRWYKNLFLNFQKLQKFENEKNGPKLYQLAFSCSRSTIEALEKCVQYVQSWQ